jgi:hypothetical protein
MQEESAIAPIGGLTAAAPNVPSARSFGSRRARQIIREMVARYDHGISLAFALRTAKKCRWERQKSIEEREGYAN